jgi:hypothetical protein
MQINTGVRTKKQVEFKPQMVEEVKVIQLNPPKDPIGGYLADGGAKFPG